MAVVVSSVANGAPPSWAEGIVGVALVASEDSGYTSEVSMAYLGP